METPLKIEEFSAVIGAGQETNALLAALSKLQKVEKPEDVTVEALGPADYWYGWQ